MVVIGESVSPRARLLDPNDGGLSLRCSECGIEIADDSTFCQACGSRVGGDRLSTVRPQDETCALPAQDSKMVETKESRAQDETIPGSTVAGPVRDDALSDGPVGKVVAGCRILRKIGQGGMGMVYLAHHEGLDKDVVVKSLPGQALGEQQLVDRFQREARAAARLDHPNVVAVHNVVREEDGGFYIVMQYVPGDSLHDRIHKSGDGLPWEEAVRLMLGCARGLEAAHAVGVVHRDLKPGNILISPDGRALLADFGLARYEDGEKLSVTGQMLGTPAYMPPELARGQTCDERSDLYSLGITFYHALTSQLPYRGSNVYEYLQKHLQEEPTPVSVLRPGIPDSVWHVVEHAMAKQPAERYPSARALAEDLDCLLRGEDVPRRVGDSLAPTSPSPESASPLDSKPSDAEPNLPAAAQLAITGAGLEGRVAKRRPALVMTAGLSGCSVVVLAVMLTVPLLWPLQLYKGEDRPQLSRLDDVRQQERQDLKSNSPINPGSLAPHAANEEEKAFHDGLQLDNRQKSETRQPEVGTLREGRIAAGKGSGRRRREVPGTPPPEAKGPPSWGTADAGALSTGASADRNKSPSRKAESSTVPTDETVTTADEATLLVLPSLRIIDAPSQVDEPLADDRLQLRAEINSVVQGEVLQAWVSTPQVSTRAFLRQGIRDGESVLELLGELTLVPGENEIQVIIILKDGSPPMTRGLSIHYRPARRPDPIDEPLESGSGQ